MLFQRASSSQAALRSSCAPAFALLGLVFAVASTAFAQIRPLPGDGGVIVLPGPGGGNQGGGGALPGLPGGGGVTPPIIIPGLPGGGGAVSPTATINTPRGALVGDVLTASVTIVDPNAPANPPVNSTNYQWSVVGARLVGDARAATVQFVAERAGLISISATVNSNGTAHYPTAQVTVFAADAAGEVTAPTTIAANVATVTASVPAAQSNDRTFRWTVSGDATIATGQNTRSITIRPGTPGLKEVICNVTLQTLVTVPVRSYLMVTGTGASVAVTIAGGVGGGTYPAGTRVDIFAGPAPAGQAFDRWVGNIETLGTGPLLPFLPHTVLTVPATPVTLTATYKSIPSATATTVANFNPQTMATSASASGATVTVTTTLVSRIPADAEGLVFLLHNTGGSGADWFSRPEQFTLVRDLLAAGYGVATLDSVNRTAGAWATQATLATNPDALNHAAAIVRLIAEGAISADKPLFFVGVAASANTALRYADLLATATHARPVKGAVLYLASGIDTLAATSRVPQFFALAANDDALGVDGIATAREHAQLLLGRGIANGTINNGVSPVHPTRFRALELTAPSFTADDARAVWTSVKEAGFLDANNYPKLVPATAALTAALPAAHRGRVADVAAQLAVAAASTEFYADANPRVINFLNARASDVAVPTPGRLVNLSARGRVAHIADSFTVGFTLRGTPRANILIRGIGPSLRRFGVADALGAPRLELYQGTRLIAVNEGWSTATNAAQITAAGTSVITFPLTAAEPDSAILLQLDPGSYTVTLRGLGGTAGQALAEVYDVSRNATRLTNLSVLSRIDESGGLLIPGVVIAGNNPRTVVMRAVGAGLTDLGFTANNVVADPRLVVLNGQQIVATNNNWAQANAASLTAVFPAVGAFPLRAAADAALLDALPPGAYTLQAGATPVVTLPGNPITIGPNEIGALLVEVYEVP